MAPKAEAGGGDDADDDDDELDDDEVHEEDDDKSEDELRAELKATRDSIKKANDSSAVRRKKIRELKGRLAAQDAGSGGRPAATDDDSKPDVDAIEKGGAARGRAEALSMVKKSGTRAALASAGVPKERLAKAVGLINLDDLDVDDEGEIDGLEDAVEELRKDWPEIFGKTVSRRRSVSGDTDSDGDRAAKVSKLTATERQAQSLVPGARLTVNK
jgi:hypothetical protein